jgi:hypothetical protein
LLALLAGPALAADAVRIGARETLSLQYPGALAVFAVDASTVETSHSGSEVVLTGRRAGQTLVTVVLPQRIETLTVQVDPPPPLLVGTAAMRASEGGFWSNRYDTLTRRWNTSLGLNFSAGEQTVRLRMEGLRESRDSDGERGFALPVASLSLESPDRTLVLLDDRVEQSPLTVEGAVLRGVHLHQGPLRAYAGVQSDQPFGDLLLPGSGDRAVGLSWEPAGPGLKLVPRAVWLPDSTTRVPGVLSLGLESGAPGDALVVRSELAWSGSLGGALDLSSQQARRQLWLRATHRPLDFAALRLARSAGDNADAAWTERLGDRTLASLSASASRLQLAHGNPRASSARADLRYELSRRWSLTGGAAVGSYRGVTGDALRRRTLSVGATYDTSAFGASALLRHQQLAGGAGGFGMRLTSRVTEGGWRANAFLDAQQQAPTLALLLQGRPDLARAIADLGFTTSDPDEVLRLLRSNAALLQERGVTLGPLQLDPLRLQGGLDLSWRRGPTGPEFGARLLSDRVPGLAGRRQQTLATLYANWHVTPQTELGIQYSHIALRSQGNDGRREQSLQFTLRTSFSKLPLPGAGAAAINGVVQRQDGESATPAAGVEVMLDRSRRTVTDAEGRFSFDRPGTGDHRVEAILPATAGVYFTTPSQVTVAAGANARFGLTYAAAVLTGVLRSDTGLPIAGATVRLHGAREASTVTDSGGAYRFAAPEGDAQVSIDATTLPPGYDLDRLQGQTMRLAPAQPVSADFTVRAQRSIQGVVAGGAATVEVPALGLRVATDATGRFALRGLPAGPLELVVTTARGSTRHRVEVPPQPGAVTGLQLRAP